MPFQVSPGVNVTEVDLTTIIPAVSTSIGGFAGRFQWGPADVVTSVDSSDTLVSIFGKPSDTNYVSFFSAANFLDYTNNLKLVRAINSTSLNASTNTSLGITIQNDDVFDAISTENAAHQFITARYPGTYGNGLEVEVCDSETAFGVWSSNTLFDAAPGNSTFGIAKGTANDELHILVKDSNTGTFTGTAGSTLERYPFLSKASDAKDSEGKSIYFKNVINRQSQYIRIADPAGGGGPVTTTDWGVASAAGKVYGINDAAYANTLASGTDNTPIKGDYTTAFDLLSDADKVDVSLLITGGHDNDVVNHVIDNIADTRKDAVAFLSPAYEDVGSGTDSAKKDAVITHRDTDINRNTSYAFMDSGWKYQYDKYSDKYRWIPTNPDVAGLCARTDNQRDAWWSPAGYNRGQIKNVVKLAFNPSKAFRDDLYRAGVNPIVTFTGEGTVLFGDKTLLKRPSAFDRINVRRLFIVLEKAISTAAKFSLFEFNDEFTRAQFRNMVEPFLRDVKGRRGIHEFKVVCDETNNPGSVIDRNEFVGDIYIKPARSINFIQLNFIAVATGVDFSEVVGKF